MNQSFEIERNVCRILLFDSLSKIVDTTCSMFVQQRNTHHNNALRLKFSLIYNIVFLYATCNGLVDVYFFLCVYLEAFSANLCIIDASVNMLLTVK